MKITAEIIGQAHAARGKSPVERHIQQVTANNNYDDNDNEENDNDDDSGARRSPPASHASHSFAVLASVPRPARLFIPDSKNYA